MKKLSIILTICLSLLSCSQQEENLIPTIDISKHEVQFVINTKGELEAANATPITAASQSMRPLTIAWIEKKKIELGKRKI